MKFLIAGLGSIGRRHFRNLLTLGERDIILYRTHQATLPDDELAGFPVETDLLSALSHHPDAVIISNPTALHLDIAIPAAQSGCYILLEKPVSHSMTRLGELEHAIQLNKLKVLVGFQFRFHPGLQKVKQLLDTGSIGDLLSARAHWGEYLPNWHPWEDYKLGYAARSDLGGGVVLTLSHPLDYLRWFLGDVESLWAFKPQRTAHACGRSRRGWFMLQEWLNWQSSPGLQPAPTLSHFGDYRHAWYHPMGQCGWYHQAFYSWSG